MNNNTIKPTQEEKAAYFAVHYGQKVINNFNVPHYAPNQQVSYISLNPDNFAKSDYLLLTSLFDINDEDAIEVARLCGLANGIIERRDTHCIFVGDDSYTLQINYNGYIRMLKNNVLYNQMTLKCYDYLRSKGYALPWMGYSVQDLQDFGWLKLKQKGGETDGC